jgi:hypothetical protein
LQGTGVSIPIFVDFIITVIVNAIADIRDARFDFVIGVIAVPLTHRNPVSIFVRIGIWIVLTPQ